MFLLTDLIAGAQQAAGKEDDPSVSSDRWRILINQAIKGLYRKIVAQFADSWMTSVDFTLTGGVGGNTFALTSDFEQFRGLTLNPTTTSRREVRKFNFANRDDQSFPTYRVMGRTVYIEPPEQAAGAYRAWYIPRPILFEVDLTATAATVSALPSNTASGTEPLTTLTATANGSISGIAAVDGAALVVGSTLIVQFEGNGVNDGYFAVQQLGDGSHPYILHRPFKLLSGQRVQALTGLTNAGEFFIPTLEGVQGVDPTDWAPMTLDPVIDPYDEYIEVYAAALALEGEKSDSSQQRARLAEMDEDIAVMASAQDAGEQECIADVEDYRDSRFRRPLP